MATFCLRVPGMGTKPAGQGAAWLNPSLPQRSQIPALESPSLPHVCVEGGFASPPPPPEIFWGSLPCAGVCYSGGGGGTVRQDRGSDVGPAVGPAISGQAGGLWVLVLAEAPAGGSSCGCLGGAGHGGPS